jgi:hypothetical protein
MGKKSLIALIIGGGLFAALIVGGFSLYGYVNSQYNAGKNLEIGLNTQYLDNQNELSTYISSFYEQVGVANLKSDKMDKILTDAVKGRYDGKDSKAQVGQGQLFSAIVEAYPDLQNNLNIYDKIVDFIRAGREAYKQKQTKLLGMLQAYDSWRTDDIIRSWFVGKYFPSSALEARIGTNVKRGEEARNQMWLIVTTQSTSDAYNTGHMDPLQVPGATPAPAEKN